MGRHAQNPREYISSFFDQSGEALEYIEEHGVEAWLSMMDGALDFLDGESSERAQWGSGDNLLHKERMDSDHMLYVHCNRRIGYVSITVERTM